MTTNPIAPSGSTFDAGALEEITFDFTKYVPGAQGVIPEPSGDQIEQLIEFLRQAMPTTEGEDGKIELDVSKIVETFGDKGEGIEDLMNTAISDVCSGVMSPDQIKALPYRIKMRFYGWILGTLLSPEA